MPRVSRSNKCRAADYLRASYYERWLFGLIENAIKHGLVTREEVESGRPAPGASKLTPPLQASMVAELRRRGIPKTRSVDRQPQYRPGDAVRTRNIHPPMHTRLPRYARDKRGVIIVLHGAHVFPDRTRNLRGKTDRSILSNLRPAFFGAMPPVRTIPSVSICGRTILNPPKGVVAFASAEGMPHDPDGPVFSEPWQAQAFALTVQLGLIALLHRLGMEHRKPKAVSSKLDPDKQAAFIKSYEDLLNHIGDDEAVLFGDAVHPTHAVRPVGCWAPKDTPVAVAQTSGRQRLNIHGAIDLEAGRTRMIDVQAATVNAISMIMLLRAIEAMYLGKRLIHLFVDNARYHHAKLVQAWLS